MQPGGNGPLINQMGVDAAAQAPLKQEALKRLCEDMAEQLAYYAGKKDRSPTLPADKMPHEWGSLDTYDDTRNALRLLSRWMDDALDPEADEREYLRATFAEAAAGSMCAVSGEVLALIYPKGDLSEQEWEDRTYADIERRML